MSDQSLQKIEGSETDLMRRATDVAGICKDIVRKTARLIQGRKYVQVEGWQSIANTYGCILSVRDVERVAGGVRAVCDVKRVTDGAILASAEGFVGEDEPTWFGGEMQTKQGPKMMPKRADFAIRAMAQTRAMSRAARTAFAFVVVLMDSGLSTTPAEEVDGEDSEPFDEREGTIPRDREPSGAQTADDWREVELHFTAGKGTKLGDITEDVLRKWIETWTPKPHPSTKLVTAADMFLRKALDNAAIELGYVTPPPSK